MMPGNPAIAMMVRSFIEPIMMTLAQARKTDPELSRPGTHAHEQFTEALRRRDAAGATAIMREHLERVFRYKPERARRIFREHFDEPGLRLIRVDGERAGCVGFRTGDGEIKIDSFYLGQRFQNRGLGAVILKALLAEAEAELVAEAMR